MLVQVEYNSPVAADMVVEALAHYMAEAADSPAEGNFAARYKPALAALAHILPDIAVAGMFGLA